MPAGLPAVAAPSTLAPRPRSKIMAPGLSHARTMVGTPLYFSPELVEDKAYAAPSDMWAAGSPALRSGRAGCAGRRRVPWADAAPLAAPSRPGCVLYELCTLRRPFRGGSVSAIAVKILRCQPAPLPEQYSPELRALVASLLQRRAERRPSVGDVLRLPLVRAHLRRYRQHVQSVVEERRASYCQSLEPLGLDDAGLDAGTAALSAAAAAAVATPVALPQPAPPRPAPQHPAARRLSADAGPDAAAAGPAAAAPGTVLVRRDLDQAPSADLASALAAAEAATADGAAHAPAVLACAETVAPKRRPSTPGSPRSLVLPAGGIDSLATSQGSHGTEAGAALEPPTPLGAGAAAGNGGARHGTVASSAMPDCSVAGSAGSLRQRAPQLLHQVDALLGQSTLLPGSHAGGTAAAPGAGPARRRVSWAEQECAEELRSGGGAAAEQRLWAVLPPPAFR